MLYSRSLWKKQEKVQAQSAFLITTLKINMKTVYAEVKTKPSKLPQSWAAFHLQKIVTSCLKTASKSFGEH